MMPNWICCNSCFHPPAAERRLAVTTCGHIICQNCFRKGNQGECLICKAQCQVSPLSDKSRPEVKALFSDVSVIANKYLSEISKAFCVFAGFNISDETTEETTFTFQTEAAPLKQIPFASPMEVSQPSSASFLSDQMDMDTQVLYRKEISGSLPRLSLISPPIDGRMGTVQHRPNSQTSLVTHSARSATVSRDKPYKRCSYSQNSQATPPGSAAYRREGAWETPSFYPPAPFRHSSLSSLPLTLPPLNLQGRMPK